MTCGLGERGLPRLWGVGRGEMACIYRVLGGGCSQPYGGHPTKPDFLAAFSMGSPRDRDGRQNEKKGN